MITAALTPTPLWHLEPSEPSWQVYAWQIRVLCCGGGPLPSGPEKPDVPASPHGRVSFLATGYYARMRH